MESHPYQHHAVRMIQLPYQYWSKGKFNSKWNPNQYSLILHMDLWYIQASFPYQFYVRLQLYHLLLFVIFFKLENSQLLFVSIVFHKEFFFLVRLIDEFVLVILILRFFLDEFKLFLFLRFHHNFQSCCEDNYLPSLENPK